MAEEMRLDLEELKHLESIAKRPRVLSLLSSEIRILDSRLSKAAAPIAQPLASAGKASAAPSYVTLDKFSWDQDNDSIKIYVSLEGVVEEEVETIFKPMSLDIKFHDVQGKNYRCAIPKFNKEILPEKCKVLVKPTIVIIVLSKASKGNWLDLHFKEDKDMKNNQSSSNQSDHLMRDILLVGQQILEMQHEQNAMLPKNSTRWDPTTQRVGTMSDFIDCLPPVFTGTEGPWAADHWIKTLKKLLEAINVPKEKMVSMACIQLRDDAYDWWSGAEWEFKEGASWDVFKERFLDRFFPRTFRNEMKNKFLNLKQGERSVEEYSNEFLRLSRFAPFVVTEESRADRFQQGLNVELQIWLVAHCFTTYSSVLNAAKGVELLMNKIKNKQGGQKRPFEPTPIENGPGMTKRLQVQQSFQHQQRPLVTCRLCGQNGHLQRDCWRANGLCLHCGAEDHQVIQCPHSQ